MNEVAEVERAALRLDPAARQELIERLVESLDGFECEEQSPEWEAEIARRLVSGEPSTSGELVFSRVRAAVNATQASQVP